MAKRSDFAQKLLDDLRLRKERMAAGQNSGRSSTMTGGNFDSQIHLCLFAANHFGEFNSVSESFFLESGIFVLKRAR